MRSLTRFHRPTVFDSAFNDVFEDFDRLFGSSRNRSSVSRAFQPNCDIFEREGHIVINFDLPGVKAEEVSIEVENGHLKVSGERKFETESTDGPVHFERFQGSFSRSFQLPKGLNAEAIEANMEDGVLAIAIPKAQVPEPQKIEIQTGEKKGFFSRLLGSEKKDEQAS